MGTNYYLIHNVCDCCGRRDRAHMCKSLTSWEAPTYTTEEPPWEERVGPEVSVKAWEVRVAAEVAAGGWIEDEYGRRHEPEELFARARGIDAEGRRHQFDWAKRQRGHLSTFDRLVPRGEWLDSEGFSFYAGEFS